MIANPTAAVFFDVDGTLVPGTSSSQYLAGHLGHLSELRVAEDDYAAGKVDNHSVAALDAKGWAGTSVVQVRGWLCGLPLVDGIADTVAWCKANRIGAYLATLAWRPVADYLCDRFGFDGACGPTLTVAAGRYTGEVERSFDEHDKRRYAETVCSQTGLTLQRCAAIGDSRSDLPLFAEVGLGIAFNATADLRVAARYRVDGPSLSPAVPILTGWLAELG